jgi:DNA modification methylase
MELKIKQEFKDLIPSLTESEYKQLEENCLSEGIRDAILTWQGYIIDGHNRYNIALTYQLPFNIEEKQFEREVDVKIWMLNNQLGRRNVTPEQRNYLIGKRYENDKLKESFKGNQYTAGGDQNGPYQKTADKIAHEFGVGATQVKRNEKFAKGVDIISKVDTSLKDTILQGRSGLTDGEIQEIGKLSKVAEKEIKNRAILINEDELKRQIEAKAVELAKDHLEKIQNEKKNHFAKVAQRIKEKEIQSQSIININALEEFNVKQKEVYLIQDKHLLIVADSFLDIEFIKEKAGNIDLVLTDPPYGISYKSPSGNGLTQRGDYDIIEGDNIEFDPSILFKYSNNVITWGANYYANKLVNSAGWLVWDKRDGKAINLNSDCEMAWTNIINSARLFHHNWNGMIKASEKTEKRIHPTQKPIRLYQWCLQICKARGTILDLFSGSGIIIIACEREGERGVAVEKNEVFASASLKRFKEHGYKVEKI